MSYTTISSGQFGFVFPSSFGPTFTLAIFCDNDFMSDDGKLFLASEGDNLASEFVVKSTGVVVSGVGTFNAFSLPKTDLSRPNTVRYYGRIFNYRGAPTDYFPFNNMHLRASLGDTINQEDWWNDNQQRIRRQLDTFPTTDEMNTAILAVLYAAMSTTQLGLGAVDTNPADSAFPILVGINSLLLQGGAAVRRGVATLASVSGFSSVSVTGITQTTVDSPIKVFSLDDSVSGVLRATSRIAGTGFTIVSDNGLDAGRVVWYLDTDI